MELLDSRRLTGPNLLWNKCGAVIDVRFSDDQKQVVSLWERLAADILSSIGWESQQTRIRYYPQGASLAISAPVDVLYTATEVNEWCWQQAVEKFSGRDNADIETAAEEFMGMIEAESNAKVLNLKQLADQNNLMFLRDDDDVSLGLGRYSRTWPVPNLPDEASMDLSGLKNIPVGLITGTNGKTTSVRLAAHVVRTAGLNAGISSTDWIAVNDQIIDTGDYSGPGGARSVLRDKRVDLAILETARGGLLRRGLGVDKADSALITNIAEDHMGEFGVQTLEELADVKWIVTSVVGKSGRVVLNADDPLLVSRARQSGLNVVWYSENNENPLVKQQIEQGGWTCTVEDSQFIYYENGNRHELLGLAEVPITVEGAATHNVQNTLGVIGLTHALGISIENIIEGLKTFSDKDNPGRCNQFTINDARVIVDFAHNPHGMKAFMSLARNLKANRKILVTGQAGDRSDKDIRNLARESVDGIKLDRILIKEMARYERGRKSGETAAILEHEFIESGVEPSRISIIKEEIDAVNEAINWAQPGDLVLLLIHEKRREVLEHLEALNSICH